MTSIRKPTNHANGSAAVQGLLDTLTHPALDAILALRGVILAADPAIGEAVKWNAPSFHTSEHFATMHLRANTGVGLIFHFGAKKNAIADTGVHITDPTGMLEWLAKDRALAHFADAPDVLARREALTALIRSWISHLPDAG